MICTNCVEVMAESAKKVGQLQREIVFLEEQHKLTVERKSNLMRDWLADQSRLNKLRCQLLGADLEPVV